MNGNEIHKDEWTESSNGNWRSVKTLIGIITSC